MMDVDLPSIRCLEQTEFALMLLRRFGTKGTRCKSYYPNNLKTTVDTLSKILTTESPLACSQASVLEDELQETTSSILESHDLKQCLEKVHLEAYSGSSDRFGLHWNILNENCSLPTTPPNEEIRAMDLLVSFLQSVLNGNDSLAAAKAMMLSTRDVLVALRRRTFKTGMSLGQTAVSIVLRSRLVGVGQIDSVDEVAHHLPSLAAYTDTVHLLQRLLEDSTSDHITCIKKVLRILCKQLVTQWNGSLALQSSLSKACDLMFVEAETVQSNLRVMEALFGSSPQRSVSHGGSIAGRPVMKLLQSLVDRWTVMLHQQFASNCRSPSQSLGFLSLGDLLSSPKVATAMKHGAANNGSMEERTPQRVLGERNQVYKRASFLNDETPPEKSQLAAKVMCKLQRSDNKENCLPSILPEQTPKRNTKRPIVQCAITHNNHAKKKRTAKQSINNQPKISSFLHKI